MAPNIESQRFTIGCYSFVAHFCFSCNNNILFFVISFIVDARFSCLPCRRGQVWNPFVFDNTFVDINGPKFQMDENELENEW
jgi:hypothetical protein